MDVVSSRMVNAYSFTPVEYFGSLHAAFDHAQLTPVFLAVESLEVAFLIPTDFITLMIGHDETI